MALNKDEINAVAKATAEIMKAAPVYQDAIQPVAQEMGKALKTLGGVINVALAPLKAMVYGSELIWNNLTVKLENKLSHIKPERIVTPRLQIVGPLLERYKYVHDEETLSEMFINLLAKAMDKDQVQKAHPSFVNIISELSPDEAKLITAISTQEVLPKLDVLLQDKNPDGSGYTDFDINFTLLGEIAGLEYPELTESYLSNLERLRVISCTYGLQQDSYTYKEWYKPLKEHPHITGIQERYRETNNVKLIEGMIRVTAFGKMFIDAVSDPT